LKADDFARALLSWHRRHGRRGLPWRRGDPYRVWLSEIMLQQTRVETVIPYYERFLEAFPDVAALARAPVDQVLELWSGLGYYGRAHRLHATARRVCDEHGGSFPSELEALQALPGIGRSTAGAIRSLAFGLPAPILDGNARRVLARYHAVGGTPATAERELWEHAARHVPATQPARYTQAIMDLGATVCTRHRPSCGDCPLAAGCTALARAEVERYPVRRQAGALPLRRRLALIIEDPQGRLLLERRPAQGVWGGLWSFPEAAADADAATCLAGLVGAPLEAAPQRGEPRHHTFSHYRLELHPVHARLRRREAGVMEAQGRIWYNRMRPRRLGLAAPVRDFLRGG